MVTHGGLVNYLYWARQYYGLSDRQEERPGAALHSSISFDLSITSLWGPLVAGVNVVLVAEAEGLEGLTRSLREQGPFGVVKLTPSHLALLNQQLRPEEIQQSAAVVVWSVDKTRWPVSAALIAAVKLMSSRISPTMMMSGSCRKTCLRA